MKKNPLFLSCDWGSSFLRLRLVEAPSTVLAEETSANGVTVVYASWKQTGKPESERLSFYRDFLASQIERLGSKTSHVLKGLPLIVSGMASSNIGMLELPYKLVPFAADASDLLVQVIEKTAIFPHLIILISGAKSDDDVMRGEEIQLVGCEVTPEPGEQLYIFPGTHSKHITVNGGIATAFQTFMTGEVFGLLSAKSLLAVSLQIPDNEFNAEQQQCFSEGVIDSLNMNPLHAFFLVRTNHLFEKMSRQENYYYLSGLLIGLELKELLSVKHPAIKLVSNERLMPYYAYAFEVLELSNIVQLMSVDEAILRGHYRMYCLHGPDKIKQAIKNNEEA